MEVLSKIHYITRNHKRNVFIRGRTAAPSSEMTCSNFVVSCPIEDDDVICVYAKDFRVQFSKKAAKSFIVEIGGVHVQCSANFESYDDGSVSVRLDSVEDAYRWFWLIVGTSVIV